MAPANENEVSESNSEYNAPAGGTGGDDESY